MSEQVREQPAPRTPVARLIGVLMSPGETFAEISRNPAWLAPFIIYMVVFLVAFGVYAMKADWISIVTEQIESSPFMKMVPDANHDQAIAKATEGMRKLSRAQLAATQLINIGSSIVVFFHLLAILFSSLFVMVGSLKDLKLGRAWGRFLLCLLVFIGYLCVYGIATFAFRDSPGSLLLLTGTAAIVMAGCWAWLLNAQAARDIEFHRVLSVCTYGSAVLMIGSAALIVVSLVHQGDIQIGADKIVPSYLGAVIKPESAVLSALFSSLDVFWIWYFVVLTIGFRIVTKLTTGMAAAMTFLPWALIVMIKIAWAAVFG